MLGSQRVGLIEVDVEFLDGFLNGGRIHFAFTLQLNKSGEGDEARVHFEEVAERGAALATAESVGAERGHAARHPAGNQVGQDLQVIRSGDEYSGRVGEALGNVGDAGLIGGMKQIPALDFAAVAVEFLVAGDAPDVGRDLEFFLENFLSFQGFTQFGGMDGMA